jgi:RNA polymerase sigma-70 factor (ECF subfamily)
MAARITRAKKKITAARIPYRVPGPAELPERIEAVLAVVHLLFTTGHTAPSGTELIRRDLTERATDLARMLHTLLPENPDVTGLLALILLTDARREARTGDDGSMLALEDQDRTRWNRDQIAEGIALVRAALTRQPGRYALQAAIAAVHAEAPSCADTDWDEVVGLYDVLIQVWPSPVVALNRAVAIGMAHGPAAGLAAMDELSAEPQLAAYSYLPAARAHFLAQLGRIPQARTSYEEAILLTENAAERAFLAARLLTWTTDRKSVTGATRGLCAPSATNSHATSALGQTSTEFATPDASTRAQRAAAMFRAMVRHQFLESSNLDNIPYYERLGYEVTEELAMTDGGPLLWPMWRTPR